MATTPFRGRIIFADSSAPLALTRIELLGDNPGFGWQAGTCTDANGEFEFLISPEFFDAVRTTRTAAIFRVFKNGAVVFEETLDSLTSPHDFLVPQRAFDETVVDSTLQEAVTNFTIIHGRLTGKNGLPVVATIEVREAGFRKTTLLASTTSSEQGFYEVKVALRQQKERVNGARSIAVRAVSLTGEEEVALVRNIVLHSDSQRVDLVADDEVILPAVQYETHTRIMERVTGEERISDIETLGERSEIPFLTTATGLSENDVRSLVQAYQLGAEMDVEPHFAYALVQRGLGQETAKLVNTPQAIIREAIQQGIDNLLIPAASEAAIEAAMDAIKTFVIQQTRITKIRKEDLEVGPALNAITGDAALVDSYLTALYERGDLDAEDFWAAFTETQGAAKTKKIQESLQLAGIAGFQPQMAAHLRTNTGAGNKLFELASWTRAQWRSAIDAVATATGASPVPKAIGETGSPAEREAYADKLLEITQDLYPLADLSRRLNTAEGGDIISDAGERADVAKFIAQNPQFDVLKTAARDINSDDFNLSGLSDPAAMKQALKPLQALYKVVGTKPDAVIALKKGGVSSANGIATMSKKAFTTQFSTAFGSVDQAAISYDKAVNMAAVSSVAVTDISVGLGPTQFPVIWNPPYRVDPVASPELATMFGSLEQCGCEHCKSVYSPAAYLVDILNFLRTESFSAYQELLSRRPDLVHIDLTCKNTNTALPYVDLVNELLERYILTLNGATPPLSYQTHGTAAELAARPEHVYRLEDLNYQNYSNYTLVYETYLKGAVYPTFLPYNFALEEARIYLQHLGVSRLEAMRRFRPWSGNATLPTGLITDRNILSEWLGISKKEADIIHNSAGGASLYNYFGFNSATISIISPSDSSVEITGPYMEVLYGNVDGGGVDVLIHQLKISYKELLELLTTRFLNPLVGDNRRIKLISKTDDVDTCVLKDLKLEVSYGMTPAVVKADFDNSFFSKLHRFVRLWRATSLSIYQLDQVLASMGATDLTVANANYESVVRTLILAERLGLPADRLTTLWSDIETERYLNFESELQDALPSLYDQLFLNKNLLNPVDPVYNFPYLTPAPAAVGFAGHMSAIVAALEMKEEDVLALINAIGIDPTDFDPTDPLTHISVINLSRIYAASIRAKASGLAVPEYLRFATLAGFPVGSSSTVAATALTETEQLLSLVDDLQKSRFSLDELQYLLRNEDPTDNIQPKNETVAIFLEKLRSELQRAPATVSARTNVIVQQFSAEFEMPAALVEFALSELPLLDVPSPGTDVSLIDALQQEVFLRGEYSLDWSYITNPIPPPPPEPAPVFPAWSLQDLYYTYQRFFKIALITGRLGFEQIQAAALQNNSLALSVTNWNDLPVGTVTAPAALSNFTRYERWARLRDRFGLSPADFLELTESIFNLATSPTPKEAWVEKMMTVAGWNETSLLQLIGKPAVSTDHGLLRTLFPEHFRDAGRIMDLADALDATSRIGLLASDLHEVLRTDLNVLEADRVLKAARSKHTEEAWLKIAKPLHDQLREGQRKALVGYVIAKSSGPNTWRNENEVYAHFLIDVEMTPCMMTSRIKQAISSVQLFVDRVIMNLEYNGTTQVMLDEESIDQWKRWRKWYRIWEANRKIFLYPENWLEPELRDDKSPFFKELETRLLQDDPDDGKVEDAFLEYLEKLDEVARLEPVTACHEVDSKAGIDIIHVVSRTYAQPQHYYYRRFENNRWSPWEQMNLEIKGDHLTLVAWNRRLYVYWLTFIDRELNQVQTQDEVAKIASQPDNYAGRLWVNTVDTGKVSLTVPFVEGQEFATGKNDTRPGGQDVVVVNMSPRLRYWDVKVNWSEHKDGKWVAPMVSKDTMDLRPYRVPMTADDIANLSNYIPTAPVTMLGGKVRSGHEMNYWFLSKNSELGIHEVFKNRLYLFPHVNKDQESLFLTLLFPASSDDHHMSLHSFVVRAPGSEPVVLRDGEYAHQMRTPPKLIANNMRFSVNPAERYVLQVPQFPVVTDGYATMSIPATSYYVYYNDTMMSSIGKPYAANPLPILAEPQDWSYRITARASMYDHGMVDLDPMHNHWFFEDRQNEFFVRRVFTVNKDVSIGHGLNETQLASLGVSAEAYFQYYLGGEEPIVHNGNGVFNGNIVPTDKYSATKGSDKYLFQTFYHPHAHNFVIALRRGGIPALLRLKMQDQADNLQFNAKYKPTELVNMRYPTSRVDFAFDGAYSHYNWEVFFHIPMMIAKSLSANQKFEDAQKWYHYIFNPTSNTDDQDTFTDDKSRFWKFRPFYIQAGLPVTTPQEMVAHIEGYKELLDAWKENPFQPHLIARMRVLAYMKNVVMGYMDNLIAWGDSLFRRNTIESINEATQLYILCANILGPKPQSIPPRAIPEIQTFSTMLSAGLDDFSNAMVGIEEFIDPSDAPSGGGTKIDYSMLRMLYFCLPGNDKLLAYWDTIADRLFKIRNCRNIEGVVQQLPLFEPPIDPALLVRAAAAGVDINSVLNDVSGSNRPHHRFSYMLQKANEFTADVRALGSELLSALEKKDAERLSLLRSGQEIALLDKVTAMKEAQIREAESALEGLQKTKENTNLRLNYYSSRPFMNAGEQKHLDSVQESMVLQAIQSGLETTVSILGMIPQFHGQMISAVGLSFGGQQLSQALKAVSGALGIASIITSAKGNMAATKAGYERRRDDWNFQADTARKELEQIDKQMIGAEIRIDIAKRDLSNHLKQIDNAWETDAFMRSKFTNEELYNWMVTQISVVYFQTYQLAYDLAKKAEQCFTYELPLATMPPAGFIRFGYWDSLRKGLLSGQRLQQDLRKMEQANMEASGRSMELTKHISLAMLDPEALMSLRTNGICTFALPKEIFDLDFPDHHARRIKSVSVSIPAIAGPYTTIAAELSCTEHDFITWNGNSQVHTISSNGQTIATSGAQNDSGVFELNFRDERYLPFEGYGAISKWRLKMMDKPKLRQFDFNTIADVIVHMKYTATIPGIGGDIKEAEAKDNLLAMLLGNTTGTSTTPLVKLPRYFSLKHEFPNEWNAYAALLANGAANPTLNITLKPEQFPFFAQDREISLSSVTFQANLKPTVSGTPQYDVEGDWTDVTLSLTSASSYRVGPSTLVAGLDIEPNTGSVELSLDIKRIGSPSVPANLDADLNDLIMVIYYKLS